MSKSLTIVMIGVTSVALGVGAYVTYDQQIKLRPEPKKENIVTSDWQTYRNEEIGFSVRHPPEIRPHETSAEGVLTVRFDVRATGPYPSRDGPYPYQDFYLAIRKWKNEDDFQARFQSERERIEHENSVNPAEEQVSLSGHTAIVFSSTGEVSRGTHDMRQTTILEDSENLEIVIQMSPFVEEKGAQYRRFVEQIISNFSYTN